MASSSYPFFGALVFLGVLLTGTSSRAQSESRGKQTDAGVVRFNEGLRHLRQKDYELARIAFQQAYVLLPNAPVLRNLAQAEVRTGHDVEAARHLTEYLRIAVGPESALAPMRDSLEEVKRRVGIVTIEANIAGAEIAIDQNSVGRAPLGPDPLFVEPGEHAIRASFNGYSDKTVRQQIRPGVVTSILLTLQPLNALTPAPPTTTPPAPAEQPVVSSGSSVSANPHDVAEPDRKGSDTRAIVLIAGGAVTVSLLTVGTIFAFKSDAASNDATRTHDEVISQFGPSGCETQHAASSAPCGALNESRDRHESARKVATTSVIAGGVLGAATLGALLLWPVASARDSAAWKVSPFLSPSRSGIELGWNF